MEINNCIDSREPYKSKTRGKAYNESRRSPLRCIFSTPRFSSHIFAISRQVESMSSLAADMHIKGTEQPAL